MAVTVIYVVEIIGTIAFAISGAMIAIERKLDMFGVSFLGVVTALGGGVVRDLIIGKTPPVMFENYSYLAAAMITSLAVFVVMFLLKNKYDKKRKRLFEGFFNVFDAVGLGIFAVLGVNIAVNAGYIDNGFLCVFVGMTTACGGGIIRDMLTSHTLMVLKSRVYALAAIIGSLVCYIMIYLGTEQWLGVLVGTLAVLVIRICAAVFRWNLPHIELDPGVIDD